MEGPIVGAVLMTVFLTGLLITLGWLLASHWQQGDAAIREMQERLAERDDLVDSLIEENNYLTAKCTDAKHRLEMAGLGSSNTRIFDDKDCEVCHGSPDHCYESQCPLQTAPPTPTCTVDDCVICNQKPMMESPKDPNRTQTYINGNNTAVEG